MKKTMLVFMCLLVLLSVFLGGCSKKSNLVGTWWHVSEAVSGIPDSLILKEDGSGSVDGLNANWSVKGDKIYFVAGILGSHEYNYSLSGGKLTLSLRNKTVVYERG